MPYPLSTPSTLRPGIKGSLTQFDTAMDRAGFVWNKILPVMEVGVAADTFGKIKVNSLLQDREVTRAARSNYSRGNFEFTTDSYATQEYGAEEVIDDNERRRYANFFDAEFISAERARDAVLRAAEARVAALVFNTTTYTGSSLTTAVGTTWATSATATPIADVEAAVRKVYDNTGLWANALIINRKVFRQLRMCTTVQDAIRSAGAGFPTRAQDVTIDMLRAVFDLSNIIVAGSSTNSANPSSAASISQLWSGSYAMVARIPESNDIREPGLGRTFHWGGDGSSVEGAYETYRSEEVRGDVVRVRHQVHNKILYTECGHLLTNIGL